MNETIKQILMHRDGMSADEADDLIEAAIEGMNDYLDDNNFMAAMDICEEYFGLEPDYLDEIMPI